MIRIHTTRILGLLLAQITTASEPILAKARAAFRKCQDFSTKYQYTDELSKSCDDWLKKHPQ